MKYRNCLEGYLTQDCKDCCNWSDGCDDRSIGCNTNFPIDWCPSFKKVYEEDSKNMRRLEKLKQERETVRNLKCLSFDLIDECTKYYDHEIQCIEEYGSDNPEVKE